MTKDRATKLEKTLPPPPSIFCQPKTKSLKITTYKSVYGNKAKIGSLVSGCWKSQIY